MGMYDDIKYEMDCPMCGARVVGFQSKDGICCLTELEYWEVDNFYTSCHKCHAWIEFNRKNQRQQVPIDAFEMTVSENKK